MAKSNTFFQRGHDFAKALVKEKIDPLFYMQFILQYDKHKKSQRIELFGGVSEFTPMDVESEELPYCFGAFVKAGLEGEAANSFANGAYGVILAHFQVEGAGMFIPIAVKENPEQEAINDAAFGAGARCGAFIWLIWEMVKQKYPEKTTAKKPSRI